MAEVRPRPHILWGGQSEYRRLEPPVSPSELTSSTEMLIFVLVDSEVLRGVMFDLSNTFRIPYFVGLMVATTVRFFDSKYI